MTQQQEKELVIVNLTGLDLPAEIEEYFKLNYKVLLASAYAEYLSRGRGLFWFDWFNELPIERQQGEMVSLYVTPESGEERSVFHELGMSSGVLRLVNDYDPEQDVIFRWFDGRINKTRVFKAIPSNSPKTLYEQMKGDLSEFQAKLRLKA